MRRLRQLLADLPPLARWGVLVGCGMVVAALVAGGVRWFWQERESAAALAFSEASAAYRQLPADAGAESLGPVADRLKGFLKEYPRSAVSAYAWYLLGNLEYRRRGYDAALAAYEEVERTGRGSLKELALLGGGYAAEAKGDLSRALDIYQRALRATGTRDFLRGELLMAVARVQEELKQNDAAVATYRQYLDEAPKGSRADEVKGRLALLGAQPGR